MHTTMSRETYYQIKACSELASAVYAARLDSDLSRDELAEKSGVDRRTIDEIEDHGLLYRTDVLFQLADTLGLQVRLDKKNPWE